MTPAERKSAQKAVLLTAVGGLAAIAAALSELPAMRHGQGDRQLIGLAVALAATVTAGLLGHIASRRELQLRSAAAEGESPRAGRIAAITVGAVAAIVSVTAFVAAFSFHAAGARSERTQSQGVQAFGRVVQVVPAKHTSGLTDTWYSAQVAVALPNNHAYYVRDTQKPVFGIGQRVRMLMDPTDRSYAEFPGLPQQERYTWIVALLICIVAASLSVDSFLSTRGSRRGARRRSLSTATATA